MKISIPAILILCVALPKENGVEFSTYSRQKPNILWINADHLGFKPGCFGNTDVKTPIIDRLASQGVRFTKITICGHQTKYLNRNSI